MDVCCIGITARTVSRNDLDEDVPLDNPEMVSYFNTTFGTELVPIKEEDVYHKKSVMCLCCDNENPDYKPNFRVFRNNPHVCSTCYYQFQPKGCVIEEGLDVEPFSFEWFLENCTAPEQ